MDKQKKTYQEQFWEMLEGQYPDTYVSLTIARHNEIDSILKHLFEKVGTETANELIRILSTDGFTKGVKAAKELKKHIR